MSNICSTISGSNLVVRVKEEAEFGKTETAGFDTIFVKSNSLNFSQNEINSELLTAGRSPSRASKGNIEVAGDIEIAIDNVATGFWLKQLLGDYSVAASDSKFLHSFKITDTCIPSFQSEKSFSGSDINYKSTGLKANELSLELGGEGELIGKVSIIGQNDFMSTIQNDSVAGELSADYAINTKNITLVDGSSFESGEIVVLKVQKGSLLSDSKAGNSTIELNLGEGANLEKGNFVSLADATYQVMSVVGDKVYLSRKLESDILATTAIYSITETNKIESISGNDIVLVNGIKQDLVASTDFIVSSTKSQILNDKSFENFQIGITSVNGGDKITAAIETMSLTFSNNAESKRLLNDKGTVGKILEGKTEITAEIEVLFDPDNARVLEEAKIGVEFDINIECVNEDGDVLTIKMPNGTLTPMTPEISSPGAISVKLSYKPYKKDLEDAIEFTLLNSKSSY